LGRQPSDLRLEDLDAAFLGRFLEHLESGRTNSVRTRNSRLSAFRTFFRYAALAEPAFVLQAQRILAIPSKRYEPGSPFLRLS
jgi:site-specific recombinase XerD